jgi:hypothetical protein
VLFGLIYARAGRQNEVTEIKEMFTMTRILVRASLFVLALTLSLSAFAASNSKSESVLLYHDAQINGKTLHAGEYTVKCETTGSNAQVKFLKNGKEVATASGQVKQLTGQAEHAQVVTQDGGSVPTISEIDFAHSTTGVSFDAGTMSAGTN